MKKILYKVMKNKIIDLIKLLGFGLDELVINLPLTVANFDSIEWDKSGDKVYLHIFKGDNYDIMFDFDDLPEEDKMKVYRILAVIYN